MSSSSAILHQYIREQLSGNNDDKRSLIDRLFHEERRSDSGDLQMELDFYLARLDNVDPVLFPYMSLERRHQLDMDLRITELILNAQLQWEVEHQKKENIKTYMEHIARCRNFHRQLNQESSVLREWTPVAFLMRNVAYEFVQEMVRLPDVKSKDIIGFMSALNQKRLYWVWGSSFIKTALSVIPESFYNSQQAGNIVKVPDPYTGALSWGLYYFRFSINLFLLIKHTIKGDHLSAQEQSLTVGQRFRTQWAQRKFTLLNDSIWGTANLLCYFWLTGKTILGTAGDAVTVGLLIFDTIVAFWDHAEQQTQYYAQQHELEAQIENCKRSIEEEGENSKHRYHLASLEHSLAQLKKNWQFQKLALYNSMIYAVTLTAAFVVMTLPFLPIAATISFTLGVVGAVLCFALTLLNNAFKGGIELYKAQDAEKDIILQLGQFNKQWSATPKENLIERKFLYLEFKKGYAQTLYQQQVVHYQTAHLIRSIIIEALVPSIFLSCTLFLPFSISLAAMGAAIGLAIATNMLINKLLQPNEDIKKLPQVFDDAEFAKFEQEMKDQNFLKSAATPQEEHAKERRPIDYKKVHGFFNKQVVDKSRNSSRPSGNEREPLLDGSAPLDESTPGHS
ncbi:MAG: hypothetical protein BGO90_05525 [Legionella sp. 40-6]|nr:hypothetical protein [Legionella sp.]OJY39264.1 MAG: hypothetical protein BGO90_05525 [Legionella sp. 40-6]